MAFAFGRICSLHTTVKCRLHTSLVGPRLYPVCYNCQPTVRITLVSYSLLHHFQISLFYVKIPYYRPLWYFPYAITYFINHHLLWP